MNTFIKIYKLTRTIYVLNSNIHLMTHSSITEVPCKKHNNALFTHKHLHFII